VRLAAAVVEAFAEGPPRAHDDGADGRIRRGVAAAARCEFAGAAQVDTVDRRERYGFTSTPFQKATWPAISFAASFGCG
jgi:hypothetical protein